MSKVKKTEVNKPDLQTEFYNVMITMLDAEDAEALLRTAEKEYLDLNQSVSDKRQAFAKKIKSIKYIDYVGKTFKVSPKGDDISIQQIEVLKPPANDQ